MHKVSYEFFMKPEELVGCHYTLSSRVGSGQETMADFYCTCHRFRPSECSVGVLNEATNTRMKSYSVDRIQCSSETTHGREKNKRLQCISKTTTGKEKAKKVQASEGPSCCPHQQIISE